MSPAPVLPQLAPCRFDFGNEWFVRVQWPSGKIQQVGAFKSEDLAQAWIEDRSAKWIEERPAHSRNG